MDHWFERKMHLKFTNKHTSDQPTDGGHLATAFAFPESAVVLLERSHSQPVKRHVVAQGWFCLRLVGVQ